MNHILFLWEYLLVVIGKPLCGKDEVAKYLQDCHAFDFVSTGDEIRKYMLKHGLGDLSRENMSRVSTELRRKFGPEFPVPGILQDHRHVLRLVLAGPRLPAEVKPILQHGGKIIAVTCSPEIRFQRAQGRGRVGDNVSLEEFVAIDQKESLNSSGDACAHNVNALLAMADFTIINEGSLTDLHRQVDELMPQFKLHTSD